MDLPTARRRGTRRRLEEYRGRYPEAFANGEVLRAVAFAE